jgi:hypothetical protein
VDSEVIVGQVWAYTGAHGYRDNPNHHLDAYEAIPLKKIGEKESIDFMEYVVEVIGLNVPTDQTVVMRVLKAEGGHWNYAAGEEYYETRKGFLGDYDLLLHVFEAGDLTNTCTKCKKDYPYADPKVNFECWSRRNGY